MCDDLPVHTNLPGGKKCCTVCKKAFFPKQERQLTCTAKCAQERERLLAQARRRISPKPDPSPVPAPVKEIAVKESLEPLAESAAAVDQWVLNPVRRQRPLRAGEPLYVRAQGTFVQSRASNSTRETETS